MARSDRHDDDVSGMTAGRSRMLSTVLALLATAWLAVACSSGSDDGEAAPPAADGSTTAAAAEPEEPTLEELTPVGTYRLTRVLQLNTYDQKYPKRDGAVWTLDLTRCRGERICQGRIDSDSGNTFRYSWDGRRFVVTPDGKTRSVFEGPCVDDATGEDVPGSKGRVVEQVTWEPLRSVREDGAGVPVRLEGALRIKTTYDGLTEGCRDLPADRAGYRVILQRQR
jgi:hypothetical protein